MDSLACGSLRIEDGKIIEDYRKDVVNIEEFNDEVIIELCRLFEDNSDVIIDYMMEKGKLKEMEKNEKG